MSVINLAFIGSRLSHGILCKKWNIVNTISSFQFTCIARPRTPNKCTGIFPTLSSQPFWSQVKSRNFTTGCHQDTRCCYVGRYLKGHSLCNVTLGSSSPKADSLQRSFSSSSSLIRGISNDAKTSLFKKKNVKKRKKTKGELEEESEAYCVTAYATCEELDLDGLLVNIHKQGLYDVRSMPADVDDAMHVEAAYKVNDQNREIFFFREGGVVFWNVPDQNERDDILKLMRAHQKDSYDLSVIHEESDQLNYRYTDTETALLDGEILLKQPEEGSDEEKAHQLQKYAFSNAISLSVKLAMWEAKLAHFIEDIEWVLDDMKAGKELRISRKQVRIKTGELFMLRHLINLESDLLLTPDFYWDREHLEPLYHTMCQHLSIPRRTKVINEKLEDCNKLTDVITDELNHKHSSKLEWYIIILIIFEVIFEVIHMIERYFGVEQSQHNTEEIKEDLRYRDD